MNIDWTGNIVLMGYRGCGKTSVGRLLADRLGRNFIDTDEMIQSATSQTIREIFSEKGEPHFRNLETEAVRQAARRKNIVIAIGGGAVLREENVAALKKTGTIIWLTAPVEVLHERITADQDTARTRPDLTVDGGIEEIRNLLTQRKPIYKDVADHVVDTTGKTTEQVADEITMRMDSM